MKSWEELQANFYAVEQNFQMTQAAKIVKD